MQNPTPSVTESAPLPTDPAQFRMALETMDIQTLARMSESYDNLYNPSCATMERALMVRSELAARYEVAGSMVEA